MLCHVGGHVGLSGAILGPSWANLDALTPRGVGVQTQGPALPGGEEGGGRTNLLNYLRTKSGGRPHHIYIPLLGITFSFEAARIVRLEILIICCIPLNSSSSPCASLSSSPLFPQRAKAGTTIIRLRTVADARCKRDARNNARGRWPK